VAEVEFAGGDEAGDGEAAGAHLVERRSLYPLDGALPASGEIRRDGRRRSGLAGAGRMSESPLMTQSSVRDIVLTPERVEAETRCAAGRGLGTRGAPGWGCGDSAWARRRLRRRKSCSLRLGFWSVWVTFQCAAVAAGAARAEPSLTFIPPADKVRCYDFAEVAIDVAGATAGNPFTGVTVQGMFGRAGEQPLCVDGFCDAADGSVFRIRFMPALPGAYDYTVTYREGDFERTHQGQFHASAEGRRGVVRVDPDYPAHFRWEGTKERYFWNGTTAYWLAGWEDAEIRGILDRLDRLKVTRVRAALSGRVKDGRAWFENVYPTERFSFLLNPWVARKPDSVEDPGFEVTRFNVAYWQKWERLLRHARDKDMVVSVIFYVDGGRPGVDPFGKAAGGGEDEQRYYRYAVARLAPFSNVMWDVANEYRLFRDDAWAEAMGNLIKACDPYDHLTSTHGHGDFRFGRSPWADFAMYQSWDEHGGYEFMVRNRELQAQTGRLIPQVNEEYGYEDHYPQGWGENRKAPARSAATRARIAWEIYLAGAIRQRANALTAARVSGLTRAAAGSMDGVATT